MFYHINHPDPIKESPIFYKQFMLPWAKSYKNSYNPKNDIPLNIWTELPQKMADVAWLNIKTQKIPSAS